MSTILEQNLNLILNEKETKILPENIKKDVQIFNIVGTLEPDKPDQTKTVTPTIEEQVITPDTGYELASVTVGAVTSNIDSNIQAGNIKKDINILGITGTYEGSGGGSSDYNAKLVASNGSISYYITEISENLDTSGVTNMRYLFNGCLNLTSIPQFDTSNVNNMEYMFSSCSNLTEIPLLDTSNVTNMFRMVENCTNLITIPQLNTDKVTTMYYMFENCTKLSDESLNNILAMCKNATSYTDTKTLKYIGLTSTQATKCTTLSNYSAFTAAGWTTGY